MSLDIQDYEREAAAYGGKFGGEYLEEIGIFDLRQLSAEQWQIFLEVIVMNYGIKRAELEPCPF